MKMTVILSLSVLVSTLAHAELAPPQTCVSPGPCPEFGWQFQHIKRVECGPWPDGLAFVVEIDQGDLPLAGAAGFSQPEQCELLRRAIAGDL
jgi:hypothetical protein